MNVNATEHVFSATAATYDPARARLIPCFRRLYASAVGLLPETADHVLDLGAGTGLLSAFVRERFPEAHLELIDNSRAMLDQAALRFAGDQEVVCRLADYSGYEWGSQYDAVVSALSIHHLPDEAKRALFAQILPALKPGGVFVNAEQILQPTADLEAAAREQWLADVRALGATEQQIADSLLRQTEDRCSTIEDQLEWLRTAGFTNARVAFAEGRFAVFAASAAGA